MPPREHPETTGGVEEAVDLSARYAGSISGKRE